MTLLEAKQEQLESLETFMASKAYVQVQICIDTEIEQHEKSILLTAPDTSESTAFLNRVHGKREVSLSWKNFFESLRDTLKAEITQLQLDSETESRNVKEE